MLFNSVAMALGSCVCRNPCVNPPPDPAGEQDELGGAQNPATKSNIGSNEASTKALTPPEALIPPLVPPPTKDFFTKFMKVFMEMTQAQPLAEPWEHPLKARTPENYWGKSHMECYHFCQQCKNHFEIFGVTGVNRTPFAALFLYGFISLRWAQYKCRHESATPIT